MARAQQALPRRSPRNHRTPPPPPLQTELILVSQTHHTLLYRGQFRLTFHRGIWYATPSRSISLLVNSRSGPPGVDSTDSGLSSSDDDSGPPSFDSDGNEIYYEDDERSGSPGPPNFDSDGNEL